MGAMLWAKTPDADPGEGERPDAAEVDESFASRRLRRWLKGMFGGSAEPPDEQERGSPEAPPKDS